MNKNFVFRFKFHWNLFLKVQLTMIQHWFRLERLECLRSEDIPCRLMITHSIESNWIPSQKKTKSKLTNLKNSPKFQIFKQIWNKHYTRHTFWSCLIRCANMKWIRRVLLKIQSGHDSVHRRTDGQVETSIPPFQFRWSGEYNNGLAQKRP